MEVCLSLKALIKLCYLTVTLQVILDFPDFMVITVLPFFWAVIIPLAFTVATFLLELL